MESLRDLPHYKEGQDIAVFLANFTARLSSFALSEQNKLLLLNTRLSGPARNVLTNLHLGPGATLAEAVDKLTVRLSRESLPALKAKRDISSYRQNEGETPSPFT